MDPSRIPFSAVIFMIVGMSLIPLGDTAGKLLSGQHAVSPAFIAWSRFAIGALLAMIVLRLIPPAGLFGDWRIWLRGGLITMGIVCILTALKSVPIANAFGAFFIGPVISYILSVWLLKEPFSLSRAGLVGLGFAGVLLVVQPAPDMNRGILFAVLAGCFYGAFLTSSRWLASVAPAPHLLLTQLVVGTVLLAPFGIPAIPEMTAPIVGLTFASAACSAAGNLLLIVAYSKAAATKLAPLVYTQLIAATALGAVVFGTLPNTMALVGLSLLFLSGAGALLMRR